MAFDDFTKSPFTGDSSSKVPATGSEPPLAPKPPDQITKIDQWFEIAEHCVDRVIALFKKLELLAYAIFSLIGFIIALIYIVSRH
jgi:hypothetical protein